MSEQVEQVEALKAMRAPFPPEVISTLPRGNARLSYVGHADLTDRLLTVDPLWQWEPFAVDERGLPAVRAVGDMLELWIRLTVCGHTRIGVGTCKATKEEATKELVGDALRNAAMRFGAALDLWSKNDRLESQLEGDGSVASGGGLVAPPAPPSEDPPMVDADKRTRFLGRLADFKAAATDEDMVAVRERLVEVGAMLDTGHVVDPLPVPVFLAAMDVVDDEWPEAAPAFGKDEGDQTVKAEPYTKADLLAFKPDGLESDEFMDLVLERAREMTPNAKPADVIRSWRGLQQKPALVRAIVDQIEAGTFLADLPEPF